MKIIKHRAFYDGMIVYGAARVGNALYWKDGKNFDLFAFKQENPAILMDYIGYADGRNGTDIYECDILKDMFDRILLVEWHRGRWCFKALTETNFKYACTINQWFERDTADVTIVGNSFENSELLTGV